MIFHFFTNFKWYPNVISLKATENHKAIGVGKRYALKHSYLFGIGK